MTLCNRIATPTRTKANQSRNAKQDENWPRRVQPGRTSVPVYRRTLPNGNYGFQVVNYLDANKRRLDSYPTEAEALAAADTLAKRIDSRDYIGASMTPGQAIEFANATSRLKPFNLTVDAATAVLAECLTPLRVEQHLQRVIVFSQREQPFRNVVQRAARGFKALGQCLENDGKFVALREPVIAGGAIL